jgi:hypothetical protein
MPPPAFVCPNVAAPPTQSRARGARAGGDLDGAHLAANQHSHSICTDVDALDDQEFEVITF